MREKFHKLMYYITKNYHWYNVRFIYKDNLNKEIFNFISQVGLVSESDTLNHRLIKKIITPLHKDKKTKNYLNNGKLYIEIQCKLGYFKKKINK